MTKCREVMTPDPACCVPTDSVVVVARMMKDEDVGAIPVVNNRNNRTLLGIVTDRDIVLNLIAEERDPRSTRIEDIMAQDPVSCREDDDVDHCLELMQDYQVRRVPVV